MPEIKYNAANREFLIFFEGENAGYLQYEVIGSQQWDIVHTVIFPPYRGKNLARYLVEAAIKEAEKQKIALQATCSYAEKILKRKA